MSHRANLFAIAIAALVLLGARPAISQTSQPSGDDEAAIRQNVQRLEDAWNAHDGKAFAAPFAADADYVVVNGMKIKGREEIEQGHARIFATVYKESRNAGTVSDVRFLRPDVALVHVEWNLEFKAGGEARKGHAMSTMVMTKEGGKWSIAAFQNTPIQEQGR
jgi:uncharacterized protein (TIGR02246 family)